MCNLKWSMHIYTVQKLKREVLSNIVLIIASTTHHVILHRVLEILTMIFIHQHLYKLPTTLLGPILLLKAGSFEPRRITFLILTTGFKPAIYTFCLRWMILEAFPVIGPNFYQSWTLWTFIHPGGPLFFALRHWCRIRPRSVYLVKGDSTIKEA